MKISLQISPLSVNAAYQGRRFKTREHKQFCNDVTMLLPHNTKNKISGYYEIHYIFHLKNFKMTDVGNLEKTITDILVTCGIIPDDRFIIRMILEKVPAKEDSIEIEIKDYLGGVK